MIWIVYLLFALAVLGFTFYAGMRYGRVLEQKLVAAVDVAAADLKKVL